jgi:hypothetical protein
VWRFWAWQGFRSGGLIAARLLCIGPACILSPMENWKEWWEVSPGPYDKELPRDQAWRMISDWKTSAKEIGVLFVSQDGTLRALATVTSAVKGAIQLSTEAATASFILEIHSSRG